MSEYITFCRNVACPKVILKRFSYILDLILFYATFISIKLLDNNTGNGLYVYNVKHIFGNFKPPIYTFDIL